MFEVDTWEDQKNKQVGHRTIFVCYFDRYDDWAYHAVKHLISSFRASCPVLRLALPLPSQ